jgi:hypothetical protein
VLGCQGLNRVYLGVRVYHEGIHDIAALRHCLHVAHRRLGDTVPAWRGVARRVKGLGIRVQVLGFRVLGFGV